MTAFLLALRYAVVLGHKRIWVANFSGKGDSLRDVLCPLKFGTAKCPFQHCG